MKVCSTRAYSLATYKFALLQSLADIGIEQGDDSEAAPAVSIDAIVEKFIWYYWRQANAVSGSGGHASATADTRRQDAVLNLVRRARATLDERSWLGKWAHLLRDL